MWVTDITKKPTKILWVEADKDQILIKDNPEQEKDKAHYLLEYNNLKVFCHESANELCKIEPFLEKLPEQVDFEDMDQIKANKEVEAGGVQAGGNQFCRVGLWKKPR